MYNPNSYTQPNITQERGLKGIKITLIVFDLFRGVIGGFLSFEYILDFISYSGGLGILIASHYLLAIVAAILLFLPLPKQRWGAGISFATFALDAILGLIYGAATILPYLIDITVIILAIIFLSKSKKISISQSAPTTVYPPGQYTMAPTSNTYIPSAGSPNVSGTPSISGKMCPVCGVIQSQADAIFCNNCGRRMDYK
jgi:hypothetical protein